MTTTETAQAGDLRVPGLEPLSEIGGGHQCSVWIAFDERRHVPVVLKALRPERGTDPAARQAVADEVAMLERLRHPGIVRILDHDVEADLPWFVLEHVDGPSLSALIRRQGALPHHHLASIGLELASTLVYLRSEGVAHLDIKPSNVVAGAPARLVDLGVAVDVATAARLTHPRGSDPYMSPEQCRPGVLGVMGPASDVWALGATLWRAASGHRPWPVGPERLQLEQPPRPLPTHLPGPVRDVLQRCLAPLAESRPDPLEVADVFADLLSDLPGQRLAGFSFGL